MQGHGSENHTPYGRTIERPTVWANRQTTVRMALSTQLSAAGPQVDIEGKTWEQFTTS